MRTWINAFLSLLFPRSCIVCNGPLRVNEECLCATCNINIPRTNYHLQKDNPVEKLFWGQIPIQRATSYFFYHKGSEYSRILHLLKYKGHKEIGETMGRYMAAELLDGNFFANIDLIIPIPLHKKKLKKRGYNQSEYIARGVSVVTGIPTDTTSVIRRINTETQTSKTVFERRINVDDIFEVVKPELIRNKHILIVDDVLTTGATTVAFASALTGIENLQISIATVAVVIP